MEMPALFSSATPRPTRKPVSFKSLTEHTITAPHKNAALQGGRHAAAARARRGSARQERPRPGPAAAPPGSLPRSPRSPGSAVQPAAQPAGRRWAAKVSAEAWRLPASPTHLGGAAAGVTAPEERPRARVRRHPAGPGPQGGCADRAARPLERTAPHALPRGG